MPSNPEQTVVSEIDRLVDESLAQPIVDDYGVNRYERCELCGKDWHGLPVYVEVDQRSCPGAWASDEAKALWRTMFQRTGNLAPTTRAGRWTSADRSASIDLDGDTFKVALFQSEIDSHTYSRLGGEVPNRNGYTTGGIRVSLASTRCGTSVEWSFAYNPVWTATGRGFTAKHAVFYDTATDAVLFHVPLLSSGHDVAVSRGSTLTIDNASTPFLTLTLGREEVSNAR